MTISKQDQAKIQKELQAAIAEVCARHNLEAPTLDVRRATTGTFVRIMKVDIFTKDIAGQAMQAFAAPRSVKIEDIAEQYNLATMNRKGDRLIAYVPSRPKYPFVYESAGGTRWKAALVQVQQRFPKAA